MNWFQQIINKIQKSDNQELVTEINVLNSELEVAKHNLRVCKEDCKKEMELLEEEIKSLSKELFLTQKETLIDNFCNENFTRITNIAYKDKMKFGGKYYSVSLNELITPNAYEVIKFMKTLGVASNNYDLFKKYADKVSQILTWTSDSNLDTSGDLYLYPAQTLAYKKCDCEDHAFLTASLNEEIGVGYGFYYPETKMVNPNNRFGHAFNVFVYNDKLYVLETTGNTGLIEEYNIEKHYYIHYIVTRDYTYKLDGSIHFGALAGW